MSDKELKQPTKQDVLDYIKKGLQKKEDTLNVEVKLDDEDEKNISEELEAIKNDEQFSKEERIEVPPSNIPNAQSQGEAFESVRKDLLNKYHIIPSNAEMEEFLKSTLFCKPIEFDISILNGLVTAHYKSVSSKINIMADTLRNDPDLYAGSSIETALIRIGWALSFFCITTINNNPYPYYLDFSDDVTYEDFKKAVLAKLDEFETLPSEVASLYSMVAYICEERFRYIVSNLVNEDFYKPLGTA